MSGLLRFFAAGIVAIAALGGSCLAQQAAEIRVVGLAFIPSTIRLDATSTLRFELRNNGAGGQRLSVDYGLDIPTGLTVVGAPRLGDNCIASAVQVTASVGSGSVNLIGLTLLPSGTCTVDVTVSAAQTGAYTATAAGNGNSILSAALTVLLPAFAQVNVSQTSVPFPPQEVGIVSATKVVTITNSGEGMLNITGITASGDFSPTQCSPASSLPYGGTCTFSIVFTPTATGARAGSVQIASNVGNTSIDVSGEGVAPLPAMSPSPLAMGTVTVNSSATANVTLTNSSSGTAALTITNIAIISGAFFSRSHNCPGLLGVDESCTIVVTYAPTSTGEHAGQLKVESNTLANARVLNLSGTAVVTAPGAPVIGTATPGNGQATITFTPPASTGGAPITSYTATASSGGFNGSCVAPCTSITVTGLTNGTSYTFTVRAANAFGPGPASAASNSVTPVSVPGAPTIGTATPGNGQATITFTPPVNSGGSPITSYTATASSGGFSGACVAPCTSITVAGLTNGTAYTFTVRAANAFGPGPASAASNSVTPATVPSAPIIGTATPGNAQATITFTPPASTGGSPITGYTVTANPGGITSTGAASPVTLGGLSNGTAYTFTVAATNAVGTGSPSTSSNSVTPATVPGAPTAVSAAAGNGQATVSFTPPASNGGSPITIYTVTSNPGGISATGTSSAIAVTGLANGTAYAFTVTAANGFGTGPSSAASNSVTPATVPGAPTSVSATASNAQATVAFNPPASNGGSAIHTYTVTSNPGGITATGAASPITLGGLSNGTTYTFTVTAANAIGTGSPSSSSNTVTPATVPGAPTAVSATAGNGQAAVSFTPPASNGGSPITSYTVTSNPGGIIATGFASPIAVTGLANGTPYTFMVTATNAVGTGSPSAASSSVTLTVSATLTPAPASFGSVVVDSSATLDVTLTSTGTSTLSLSSISLSASLFFTQTSTCTGSLAPNMSCVITLKYTPTATGNHTAQLTVSSNAAGSPHVVAISGTGIAPGVSLTPTPVNFGNVSVGTNASSTLTLANTGTAPLSVMSITATGTSFTQAHTCPNSLSPGASCPINVTFAPTVAGSHSGQVSVLTNVGTSPLVAPLSGVGAVPAVGLSAASLDFALQTINTQSSAQSVTVTNTGSAPLDFATITAVGDYSFLGCVTPLTVIPGASCTLSVKFLPTATGLRAGSIAVATNAADSPHSITLAGHGTPAPVPGIAVAPASVEFGAIIAGSSIVTHLALTSTGTAPLAIAAISTSAAAFTQTNTCPASLAPSAACNISVTYAPGAAGSHSGELHVVSNAVPSPLVVPLSGSSLPVSTPLLQLSSTGVVFAPQFVNVASSPKVVTLLNAGLAPLQISAITSTGDFGYSGCGFPATLLPGQSCTFSITFKPLSVGALSGAIQISSNAPGGPHTISLSGNGASFAVPEISLSPSHLAFEPQRIGAVATQRMGLRNAGASVLEISSIGASGAHFSQGNDCPAMLAVGAGCEIVVTYAPTAIGAHGGHVVIESNAVPSPHAAPLSGTAIAVPPPFLAVDRLVDFGQQVVGTTAREALRLANTGGHHLVITAARILGGTEFGIGSGCASIAPAASCVLELTFTPTALREFAARLDIVSNHTGGVVQVDLAGAGVPKALPDLELSAAGLGWGNQTLGTLGEARVLKLTSIGGEALRINAITASADFVVDAGQCPALLDPKRSCEVRVTFRPLAPGPRQGRLTIDSNASGEPDSVSLTGVGCRLFTMGAARNPSRLCAP